MRISAALLVVVMLMTACGESRVHYRSPDTGTPYYPPPAAFREISIGLGERMPETLRSPRVDLLFATTRAPAPAKPDGLSGFSDEPDGGLRLGTIGMNIGPTGTTWSDLIDWARLNEQQIPPVRVSISTLEDFGFAGLGNGESTSQARFLAALEPHYVHGGRRVLLFVHGYNTTFAEAAATLACMHHHQGRRGAALLFSWPAGTEFLRYLRERDLARESTNALARLISALSGPGKVERIDVIVNSTGAFMLIGALHQLEATVGREAMAEFKLGNVVLASPDLGLDEFVASDLPLLAAATKRTVVYSNREDRALGMSSWWYDGLRLGRVEQLDEQQRALLTDQRERLELVDVTALPGPKDDDGFSKHGAWYANPLVSTDVLLVLLRGESAAKRGLVHGADSLVWNLPVDYAVQSAASAMRIIEEKP